MVSKWSCLSEPSSAMDFSFDCVPLVKGACCVQDAGSCLCTEVAAVDCAGTYCGDDRSCTDTPAPWVNISMRGSPSLSCTEARLPKALL